MSTKSKKKGEEENKILCCSCGILIPPNPSNMCVECIRSQIDITADFQKEEMILFCRECERYLQPPKYWAYCELESRELLSMCLKRIKGLQKNDVKLVDAKFLWTEPHSRRLKVHVTVQKEVFNGTKMQQSFVVVFVVKAMQCDDCKRTYTKYDWQANVQVRQKVDHKKTFFHLEQMILRYDMQEHCLNISEKPDGLDFYFNHKSYANKFKDFVVSMCPTKVQESKKLMTHDPKNNIYNYKYTLSCLIAPCCREDLICLSPAVSSKMGGLGPICLCYKVNQSIHVIDPQTLKTGEYSANLYFKNPLSILMNAGQMQEFFVMDTEYCKTNFPHKKFELAEVEVCPAASIGESESYFVKTHLGHVLQPGDIVMGYDLVTSSFNEKGMAKIKKKSKIPEIVLVRKVYEKRNRNFKLNRLNIQKGEDKHEKRTKEEYEQYLDAVQEDSELRRHMKIMKDKKAKVVDDDEALPLIDDDELIDSDEDEPIKGTTKEIEQLEKSRADERKKKRDELNALEEKGIFKETHET